jgi:hypothetical protein
MDHVGQRGRETDLHQPARAGHAIGAVADVASLVGHPAAAGSADAPLTERSRPRRSGGTELRMGFVATMGNPSRRSHCDRHAPSAVGTEARRVERAPASRAFGRGSTAAGAVGVSEWRVHVRRIVRSFLARCLWRLRSRR